MTDFPVGRPGPLTSEQVTFALPLVVRDRNRLKLRTRSGAVSPLHSDEVRRERGERREGREGHSG